MKQSRGKLLLVAFLAASLFWYFYESNTVKEIRHTINREYSSKNQTYPEWITSYLPSGVKDYRDADIQTLYNIYFSFTDAVEIPCKRKVRVGKLGNGGWDVCDDYEVQPRKPCLIYSYGISKDWSFDDQAANIFQCEIHSFDPTIGLKEHNRSELVHFHPVGLGSSDSNGTWKMRTLKSMKKELGHEHRIIDVLKMDIEFSEWGALPVSIADSSLKSVRQLSVEFHVASSSKKEMIRGIDTLLKLYNIGFRKFFAQKNVHVVNIVKGYKGSLSRCAEVNYLNIQLVR